MGTSQTSSQQRTMLHLLLASSLVALASAEADPQLLCGAGLPYAAAPAILAPVGAVAHPPKVKSDVLTPAEVSHEVTAHTVAYAGYAAHPAAYAGYAAPPLAYHGLPVLAAPAAAEEAVVAERKKREADPQVLLNGAVLPYSGPPYAAAPAVLAPVGAVAHAPVVKSVVEKPAEVAHEVTAHAVPVAVGYHGLPYWG